MTPNQHNSIKDLWDRFWNFGHKYGVWYVVTFLSGLLVTFATKYLTSQPSDTIGLFFLSEALLLGLLTYAIIALHKELEQKFKSIELGQTVRPLGITGITAKWKDFFYFAEPFGKTTRELLGKLKGPATWYIVTINPAGMMTQDWLDILKKGVEEQGITVKWVYYPRNNLDNDKTLRAFWQMFTPELKRLKGLPQEMEDLSIKVQELHHLVENSQKEIKAKSKADQIRAGHWELYESRVPHFYMAFLSVPGKYKELHSPESAPDGTFGFVHLYLMFSNSHDERPAIYLDTRGSILNDYYWSITQLFKEGVEQNYLQPVRIGIKSDENPKEGTG